MSLKILLFIYMITHLYLFYLKRFMIFYSFVLILNIMHVIKNNHYS